MKNISVSDFKGESFSGEWNEKTYSSQISGKEDLYRIYVSNEPIHITRQELEKITSDINKNDQEVVDRILKMTLDLSEEQKKQLFLKMVTSDEFLANFFRESVHKMLEDLRFETISPAKTCEILNNLGIDYEPEIFLSKRID